MSSAPKGVVETGAPSFVVMGPEEIGLSLAPTDLHVLPDGRVLVVSQRELAFGDGVRWDTFRSLDGEPPIISMVAVDGDGQIYTGLNGGFARIDLGDGGRWHFTQVAMASQIPDAGSLDLTRVAVISDQWYWYGGTKEIVSWTPGQPVTIRGTVDSPDRIFNLEKDVFLSQGNSGELVRLKGNGGIERIRAADILVSETVTCTIPFGDGQLLAGTGSVGPKLFDGKNFRPFGPAGPLNSGHRITDLCTVGGGLYAAAVDTIGIVFFDRQGRTVQVLDRSLDHRLARVRLLKYSNSGVLWALMDNGIARVEFPSPVSHFEPLVPSGLSFAQPLRHDGQLWILADGRAMHGVYDNAGRLERFDDDTPPGRYLFTLTEAGGQMFGGNDRGIFVRDPSGWREILPGIVNARVWSVGPAKGEWDYAARGEFGFIKQEGPDYSARRFPAPGLADNYGAVVDAAGTSWLELGNSEVGRIDVGKAGPVLRILGADSGLGDGWIEPYIIDGSAHFHWGDHLVRFDDSLQRFVPDSAFLARYPQLAVAGGRPVTDALGRLWFSDRTAPVALDRGASWGGRPIDLVPVGFTPTSFTAEDDGVVWMFQRRRLVRMDLRFPAPARERPHALITSVQFSSSNRQIFGPAAALQPLPYADNSLVIHFAAPGNPFASPVSFEVMLEGAGTRWVSTGIVGSAAFNHLKEGDYTFRVRPIALGGAPGHEARLRFTVKPPWYRSTPAWFAYAIAVLGVFAFVVWLSSFLQHRENVRLERLITERTKELNATNAELGRQILASNEKSAALAASEERYRLLNTELEKRVADRTAQLTATLEKLSQARKMEAVGQLAGGVAHDYNNILTATLMQIGLLSAAPGLSPEVKSGIDQLELMAKRSANLTRRLLTFSRQQVVQIKAIDVEEVIDNLVRMLESLLPETVELDRQRAGEPLWIEGDSGSIEQIVTNLCVNARDAMMPKGGRLTIGTARVTLGGNGTTPDLDSHKGTFVRLTVKDEGCGMSAKTLEHIFEPFFTTKEMGTGLGLATVYGIAKQHRGWVEVSSDLGNGSEFRVFLPETGRAPAASPKPPAPVTKRGHECILAVEDEDAVRTMAVKMLTRIGYRVLEAVDGEDAIRVWNDHKDEIDLLFSDMVMPKGYSGIDLANRFKTERPKLKVVITSGYSVNLTKESILNGPGFAFLGKPYQVNGLADVLRKSLDGVGT
jgi:signal transduction histidine kinase/ActR/RegA family two-component response regulator